MKTQNTQKNIIIYYKIGQKESIGGLNQKHNEYKYKYKETQKEIEKEKERERERKKNIYKLERGEIII